MKVLLIEDDRTLVDYVAKGLRECGHVVDICRDGKAGLYSVAEQAHDVVVLDRMLPGVDGMTILQTMRAAQNLTPVLIMTALGEVDDRVEGLRKGGDDYLPKPFSLLELQSRMQAVSRRKFGIKTEAIPLGEFTIDLQKRVVSHGDYDIELTRKEFDLLSYMLLHKNRVLTRMQLSEHIWGSFADDDYDSNYIDVHVKNIRKKLGAYGPVDWLETVRGMGYKIKKQA